MGSFAYVIDGQVQWRLTPVEMRAFVRIAAHVTLKLGREVTWTACAFAYFDARNAGEIRCFPLHRDVADEPIIGLLARRLEADPQRYAGVVATGGTDPEGAEMIGQAAHEAAREVA